ncbi:chlorophyll A-B-binding protein [Leptolyngbya cf. ectocarpi LEGE 11479]|uniref:Chlorophyll A-B-binding protein n=1 Tax=Leptolyngbya cf. ectocarpi LEGE 11479 TaxID=1828722 RepID=A0A928ZZI1_LEPEC|nr:chlorophyll a/b-binding protein [Leptolyngbya ectocarpi]MBE9070248.1 chlorophyll A-B-binding protein [Leptolyngbya cf. ectocarpi LEGE 11479]
MPKSNPVESDTSQSSSTVPPAAEQPGFGWTTYAERINGRFAMVGFLALLLLEFFTRQDFFTWVGLP